MILCSIIKSGIETKQVWKIKLWQRENIHKSKYDANAISMTLIRPLDIFTPPCPPSFITRELQYPPKIRFLNHPRPFNATNRGNEQSRPAIRGEYNYTHSLRADCNPAGNQTRLPYRRTINSTTAQCDTCPLSRFVKSPRLI